MFSEPYTYWETVSPYWHNWPLPLFKHVPQLLWYNIFFSGSVCSLSLFSISFFLSCPYQCPRTLPFTISFLCSLSPWAIHLQHSNSGRWFPTLPFCCHLPGESHGEAWFWNSDELQPRSWTKLWGRWHWSRCPIVPHHPCPFLLSLIIPLLCSFLFKSVQNKSWSLYTVTLIC